MVRLERIGLSTSYTGEEIIEAFRSVADEEGYRVDVSRIKGIYRGARTMEMEERDSIRIRVLGDSKLGTSKAAFGMEIQDIQEGFQTEILIGPSTTSSYLRESLYRDFMIKVSSSLDNKLSHTEN